MHCGVDWHLPRNGEVGHVGVADAIDEPLDTWCGDTFGLARKNERVAFFQNSRLERFEEDGLSACWVNGSMVMEVLAVSDTCSGSLKAQVSMVFCEGPKKAAAEATNE